MVIAENTMERRALEAEAMAERLAAECAAAATRIADLEARLAERVTCPGTQAVEELAEMRERLQAEREEHGATRRLLGLARAEAAEWQQRVTEVEAERDKALEDLRHADALHRDVERALDEVGSPSRGADGRIYADDRIRILAAERDMHLEQLRAAEETIAETTASDLAGLAAREAQAPTAGPSREEPEAIAALREWCAIDNEDRHDTSAWVLVADAKSTVEAAEFMLEASPEVLRLYDEARAQVATLTAALDERNARVAEMEAIFAEDENAPETPCRCSMHAGACRACLALSAHEAEETLERVRKVLKKHGVTDVDEWGPGDFSDYLDEALADITSEVDEEEAEEEAPGSAPEIDPVATAEAPSVDPGERRAGESFTSEPGPEWRWLECPDEDGAQYEVDPCQGCAGWGEACGAIYVRAKPEPDPVHAPTGDLPPVRAEAPRVEDAAPEVQAETMRPWRADPPTAEDAEDLADLRALGGQVVEAWDASDRDRMEQAVALLRELVDAEEPPAAEVFEPRPPRPLPPVSAGDHVVRYVLAMAPTPEPVRARAEPVVHFVPSVIDSEVT